MTAIANLLAQRNEIERQIAQVMLPTLNEANELLSGKRTSTLLADVQALSDKLPDGDAKTQLGNVIAVLTYVPTFIASEHDRLTNMVTPPTPPEPVPAPSE